jgi:hypothetical protein
VDWIQTVQVKDQRRVMELRFRKKDEEVFEKLDSYQILKDSVP